MLLHYIFITKKLVRCIFAVCICSVIKYETYFKYISI